MKRHVHSALSGNRVSNSAPCGRVKLPSGLAFTFDITHGFLPPEYNDCDVIFAMMPWRAGYNEFNRRAGIVERRHYFDFVGAVSRIITNSSAAFVLAWGKHAERLLPPCDWKMPMASGDHDYGNGMIFYGWGLSYPPASRLLTREQMLVGLCNNYSCIGDFCCGYGETGYYAILAGKRFVLSDHNPQCIGDIAENHGGWGVK